MLKKAFVDKIGAYPKVTVVNVILVANALIWYFYAFSFLMEVAEGVGLSNSETLVVWGTKFLGVAIAALFGSFFIYRLKRRLTFLRYWMLAGVILSLTPIAFDITELPVFTLFLLLVGVYFGLGVPVCLGYFAATTEARNRSRLGGITFLSVFVGFFLLSTMATSDITLNSGILAACKAIGLVFLLLLKPEEKQIGQSGHVSFVSVIKSRPFLLYFVPWGMFSIVNSLAFTIVGKFFPSDFFHSSIIVENVLSGIFAIVFGFLGDYIGRKRLTVTGFALLGLGYASLGLLPGNIYAWCLYTAVDGIAWGCFFTIFLITIWGDLAQGKSSEKYYAIGSMPYLVSNFLRISIGTYIGEVPQSAVFSFASVFLFLAVLPLMYAPETLPEKTIRERELKSYIEKAQKEAEKTQNTRTKDEQREKENDDLEIEVIPEDFEEKLKEAEQYY